MPTVVPVPDLTFDNVIAIVANVGDWLFVIALVIAPIMIVIGAALFISGAANPSQLQKAKQIFLGTAIGFVLVLFAKAVFTVLRSVAGV